MEDPNEAALYHALRPSLRGRHAGAVIRQALTLLYAEQLAKKCNENKSEFVSLGRKR